MGWGEADARWGEAAAGRGGAIAGRGHKKRRESKATEAGERTTRLSGEEEGEGARRCATKAPARGGRGAPEARRRRTAARRDRGRKSRAAVGGGAERDEVPNGASRLAPVASASGAPAPPASPDPLSPAPPSRRPSAFRRRPPDAACHARAEGRRAGGAQTPTPTVERPVGASARAGRRHTVMSRPTALMVSLETSTSARNCRSAFTTVPPCARARESRAPGEARGQGEAHESTKKGFREPRAGRARRSRAIPAAARRDASCARNAP